MAPPRHSSKTVYNLATVSVWRYLTFLLLASLLCAQTRSRRELIIGIDHIPVVVADLEKAQADFRALGFRIKPGRPHADGIGNARVKFPDGSEIELITAPAAVDAERFTAKDAKKSREGREDNHLLAHRADPFYRAEAPIVGVSDWHG